MSQPGKMLLLLVCTVLVLAACDATSPAGDDAETGAAAAIEAYLNAMVNKDQEAFSELYCADYEADARTEFDSFGAVEASLTDLACENGETVDGVTLVNCTGTIDILYNGEERSLDTARDPYRAVQEDGLWRMCGYERD